MNKLSSKCVNKTCLIYVVMFAIGFFIIIGSIHGIFLQLKLFPGYFCIRFYLSILFLLTTLLLSSGIVLYLYKENFKHVFTLSMILFIFHLLYSTYLFISLISLSLIKQGILFFFSNFIDVLLLTTLIYGSYHLTRKFRDSI